MTEERNKRAENYLLKKENERLRNHEAIMFVLIFVELLIIAGIIAAVFEKWGGIND